MSPAYDLSQWQSAFTASQVQNLKSEASFVILRVQYGSTYQDSTFKQNVELISKAKIPYGVYSYSRYTSPSDAETEAKQLHSLAPRASFYVNDIEENNAGSALSSATIAWAQAMKRQTSRPVVIYSGLSFMNQYLTTAKNSYDAIWIASYSDYEPNPDYHYDLWQYTDRKYSSALNQNVDASVIPSGGKPLSFWTNSGKTKSKTPRKIKVKVHVHKTKKYKVTKWSQKQLAKYYYTDTNIVYLKVINKNGVGIYTDQGKLVSQAGKGSIFMIKEFKRVGNTIQAVGLNGNHFTAKKGYVEPTK